jgi:hypothetical protein
LVGRDWDKELTGSGQEGGEDQGWPEVLARAKEEAMVEAGMRRNLGKAGHEMTDKTKPTQPAPVAHACNPSYSGGKDQEDGGLKPVLD